MSLTPTALTLRKLREDGWLCEVVEKWNAHARVRNDLFGFIDVLAIKDGTTLGVQATSATNVSARIHKIADHPNLPAVRDAGWSLAVAGWRKAKNGRWECRWVDVS